MSTITEIRAETAEHVRTTGQLMNFLTAGPSIMTSREMFEAMFTGHTPKTDTRTPADVQAQKEAGEL